MKVADFRQLGMLPLQDHRDILPEFRASVQCGRIEDRDEFGRYQIEGHQDSESDVMTLGDLMGGFFVQQQDTSQRQQGAWLFAGAAVTTSASERATSPGNANPNQTRTRTGSQNLGRTVMVRPIGDTDFGADSRFKEFEVALHPGAASLPAGSPLVVLSTMQEDEQKLLGFPTANNALICVNEPGADPTLSSIVYDLTSDNEIDKNRSAFLHTFWRIAKLGGGCSLGTNDALVWQLGKSGVDKIDGRGLVIDKGGVPSSLSSSSPEPGSVEAQDGKAGATQHGAVTTVAEFQKALYDRLAQARADNPTGTAGAVTVVGGGKEFTSQTRPPPQTTQVRPPPDTTRPRPTPKSDVLASMSARNSGPIDVGDVCDIHRLGLTKDGHTVNAAHLAANSLFRNEIGDGPLDFEAAGWEEPEFGGPFLSPVHLRWNPGLSHDWVCGQAPGRWQWVAETFFFVPSEKTRTPPPWLTGPPPCMPPPPPPCAPPPKECQNIPGGGGNNAGPTSVGAPSDGSSAVGPGTTNDINGFDLGGALSGGQLVSTGGGTGQAGLTNSGGTFTIGPSGPSVPGVIDAGVAAALKGDPDLFGDGGSAANAPQPDVTGPALPPELGDPGVVGGGTGTGVGETGTGDGMVPGGEPPRPEQKGGGPGDTTGSVIHSPIGGGGSHRKEDQEKNRKPDETCGGSCEERIPIGGLSVFGGGSLPPSTMAALYNDGVLDLSGRPRETPPPRVGDGTVTRMGQLGGVTSRTPMAAQTMGFGGGIKFAAYATANGQPDFTRGGWIQSQVGLLADAGMVGAFSSFGMGNGTWEDVAFAEGSESIDGGVVFGSPELTQPEIMAAMFTGDFHFGSAFSNTAGTESRLYFPGALSQVYFAHPSNVAVSGVVGGGGVRMAQTSVGLAFTALDGNGLDTPTDLLFGEGGLNLDGNMDIDGNLDVSGKLTVGGSIDPTDVQLTDTLVGSTAISAAAAGFQYDSAVDTRPLWKEDNVTGDNAFHALAYLSDTGAGGGATVIDTDSAAEATQSIGTTSLETLKTIVIPANTCQVDGDIITFHAGGRVSAAAGGAVRAITFNFGSSGFAGIVVAAQVTQFQWSLRFEVVRTGAAAQTALGHGTTSSGGTSTAQTQQIRGTASESYAASITCLIRAQDFNAEDDIACDYFYAQAKKL